MELSSEALNLLIAGSDTTAKCVLLLFSYGAWCPHPFCASRGCSTSAAITYYLAQNRTAQMKLQRELEAVKKNEADASRVLVLENLLEDANRMKARYEADYLAAHREKLVLQANLEEIRSGKSMGDGFVYPNPTLSVCDANFSTVLKQQLHFASD